MLHIFALAAAAFGQAPEPQSMEDMDWDMREAAIRAPVSDEEQQGRLDRATLALRLGDADMARGLLEPIAAGSNRADLHQTLGLAWLSTYHSKYGLSESTWTRLQGVAVDPEGARKSTKLRQDEIPAALARGYALPAARSTSGVRGGGAVPMPLAAAIAELEAAHRLAPSDAGISIDLYAARLEAARFDKGTKDELSAIRAEVLGLKYLDPTLDALRALDYGVDLYLQGDPSGAVTAFSQAEQLGSPLGTYDRGVLLAFDPSFADRRDEGFADLASFAAGADSAERAGVLATRTPWPLGGEVEVEAHGGELLTLVELIEDPTGAALPADAVRSVYGPYVEVRYDDGRSVLVDAESRRAIVSTGKAAPEADPSVALVDDVLDGAEMQEDEGRAIDEAERANDAVSGDAPDVAREEVTLSDKRKKPRASTDSSNIHVPEAPPFEPAAPVAGYTDSKTPVDDGAEVATVDAPVRPQGRSASVLGSPSRRVELRRASVCDPVDPAIEAECQPAWEVRLIE